MEQRNVLEYNAIFEKEPSGGYSVWVPDLPGCASQGETFDEAVANIKEAIELYIEDIPVKNTEHTDKKQFIVPITVHAQTADTLRDGPRKSAQKARVY